MKADLEILARELQTMAEDGVVPDDGMPICAPAILWAQGWLLTLAELGVAPASERQRGS